MIPSSIHSCTHMNITQWNICRCFFFQGKPWRFFQPAKGYLWGSSPEKKQKPKRNFASARDTLIGVSWLNAGSSRSVFFFDESWKLTKTNDSLEGLVENWEVVSGCPLGTLFWKGTWKVLFFPNWGKIRDPRFLRTAFLTVMLKTYSSLRSSDHHRNPDFLFRCVL